MRLLAHLGHGQRCTGLHDVAIAVAARTLLGVEIGEYEGPASADVGALLDTLAPVLA